MKITLKIIAICFLLFSCNQTSKEVNEKSNKKVVSKQQENLVAAKEEIASKSKNEVTIKFSDLTVSLKDIDMGWQDEGNINDNIYETKKDTAFFDLYPGDWMFKKSFEIDETAFDEIELYGQFEIKIGVTTKADTEVPFCVLDDWKSYTSEWSKLKIDRKDLKFAIIEEKKDYPIDFSIEELKGEVKKHCGTEWSNDIRNIQSIDKLPISFFLTKYVYKIKAKNSKTNKVVEKYIVFYTPTSC